MGSGSEEFRAIKSVGFVRRASEVDVGGQDSKDCIKEYPGSMVASNSRNTMPIFIRIEIDQLEFLKMNRWWNLRFLG